jgi:hypothetical protein
VELRIKLNLKLNGLSGLYNPYGCSNNQKPLTITASNNTWLSQTLTAIPAKEATTHTISGTLNANTTFAVSDCSATATVRNYNNSTGVATSTNSITLLNFDPSKNTNITEDSFKFYLYNGPIDSSIDESSTTDSGRIKIDETVTPATVSEWVTTDALKAGELMLDKNAIVFPKNYNGFNYNSNDYSNIVASKVSSAVYYIAYETTLGTSKTATLTVKGSNLTGTDTQLKHIYISPVIADFSKCDALEVMNGIDSGLQFTTGSTKAEDQLKLSIGFTGNGTPHTFMNDQIVYIKIVYEYTATSKETKITSISLT